MVGSKEIASDRGGSGPGFCCMLTDKASTSEERGKRQEENTVRITLNMDLY